MINSGLLNPDILSLLARIRHTNALMISDRSFPFWPDIETVDVSVVDDLPTVLQLIAAVRANHNFTQAYMAREFLKSLFENRKTHKTLDLTGLFCGFDSRPRCSGDEHRHLRY
jgi:D-ribose pyranase